ncbi:hypothetical protein STFR1_50215 [Bacillus vallismortis]
MKKVIFEGSGHQPMLEEPQAFDQSSANGWKNKKTARGIKNPRAVFLL